MDILIVALLVGVLVGVLMIIKDLAKAKSEFSKELKNLNDALKNNH